MKCKIEIKIDLEEKTYDVDVSPDLPGHLLVYKNLGKIALLHALKNLDYGDGNPLGNFKFSEEITGVPAWKGALVRLTDKWGRIKSIVKRKDEKTYVDESLDETLLDNAVYSLIILALRAKENKNMFEDDLDEVYYP